MIFANQTLDGFLEAKTAATELLRKEEAIPLRTLSLEEAITLEAALLIFGEKEECFGKDIAELTRPHTDHTYDILGRFVKRDKILKRKREFPERSGDDFKVYSPTDLGNRVLHLFTPETPEP